MQQNLDLSINSSTIILRDQFLNRICFLPREGESEEEFLARVDKEFFGGLKRVASLLKNPVPETFLEMATSLHIDAKYLPWAISKKRLFPWHLGVYETDGKRARIQIHPRGVKKKRLPEVLSHEAVHHLRKDLSGPYEELLSYLTSKKPLYRSFGFFLTSIEFKIALALSLITSLLSFWVYHPLLQWSGLIICASAFFLCRYRLRAPFKLLKALIKEKISSPLALLIRLSTKEIDCLADEQSPSTRMRSWKEHSFRWQFLSSIYIDEERSQS